MEDSLIEKKSVIRGSAMLCVSGKTKKKLNNLPILKFDWKNSCTKMNKMEKIRKIIE